MRFSFNKPLIERAVKDGKGILAVCCDGRHLKKAGYIGRSELNGMMEEHTAQAVFMFAALIYKGKTPQEAFAETNWSKPEKNGEQS